MVVGLVAQSDPQLPELLHPLAVDLHARLCRHGWCVVPKDIAHVVEQAGHRHQKLRLVPLILAFQNVLGVWMAIRIRHPEAIPGRFFIFGDAIACEVQLAQQVAGPGMILVSCIAEILRRFDCIFLHGLAFQVFLARPVGGVSVSILSRSLQPLDSIISVMHLRIIREI